MFGGRRSDLLQDAFSAVSANTVPVEYPVVDRPKLDFNLVIHAFHSLEFDFYECLSTEKNFCFKKSRTSIQLRAGSSGVARKIC